MQSFSSIDLIAKKRDGLELSAEEIDFLVQGAAKGTLLDYQLSAWLMAAYLKGLSFRETKDLTYSMMRSGKVLDLTSIAGIKVDKHSTGGVGDKVSLILAPMVAAAGVSVPMMAGRGLGHTGGTIDKLESIPGFRTDLSSAAFIKQIKKIGVAITSQTKELAPADGKFYALRDVTATVESIPLIAASIMAKKLAEGIDALVLDVKVGEGAFMKNLPQARKLAKTMAALGEGRGKKVAAILTDMEEPLGLAVGNALEVKEAVQALKGEGPPDLVEVTLALGAWMLVLGEKAANISGARKILKDTLSSGRALEKLKQLIKAQSGDSRVIERTDLLPAAPYVKTFKSPRKGYVQKINAGLIGRASLALGAGRSFLGEPLDLAAGIVLRKKTGDRVEPGEPLAVLHYKSKPLLARALPLVEEAFIIGDRVPIPKKMILGKI